MAAPGLVITNAHVVAGETDTQVEISGLPPGHSTRVVRFDPHDDIAVLRVSGLSEPTLKLAADPRPGTSAAILGYPLDGPFVAEPGRIGVTQDVRTQDAYGQGDIVRSITPLRGLVRPGNSGGPMVDASGEVVATVFAAVTGTSAKDKGGFAIPNALVRRELGGCAVGRPREYRAMRGLRVTRGRAVVCTPPPARTSPRTLWANSPPVPFVDRGHRASAAAVGGGPYASPLCA